MQSPIFSNTIGAIPHPLVYTNDDGFLGWMDMDDLDILLDYYRFGLFPWENYGNKGAFFFPKLRYLIRPEEIKIAKSIRPYFNQKRFGISFDQAFDQVMISCKYVKRKGNAGTWISEDFLRIYGELHRKGYAHSVEVWDEDLLVGGLYGISVGKIFTGESMFSLVSNASRYALISLAHYLKKVGIKYIDCQIKNPYLEQFGGFDVTNEEFLTIMKNNYFETTLQGNWGKLFSQFDND